MFSFKKLLLVSAAATFLTVSLSAQSVSQDKSPSISVNSQIFVDKYQRQIIFHGLNEINKQYPNTPEAMGFDTRHADFIKNLGFNVVRLGFIWAAFEPQPGIYKTEYLDSIKNTVEVLAQRGIYTIIDFHQDAYGVKHGGMGFPEWASLSGTPMRVNIGFPANLFGGGVVSTALDEDFDRFWENSPTFVGVGVQDLFIKMTQIVANSLKGQPFVLGYEIMNEPFPGSNWKKDCWTVGNKFDGGCAQFDRQLTNFYAKIEDNLRKVDQEKIIFFEPNVLFDLGAVTFLSVDQNKNKNLSFSFHNYDLERKDRAIENAVRFSSSTRVTPFMTEFGANADSLDRTAIDAVTPISGPGVKRESNTHDCQSRRFLNARLQWPNAPVSSI